MCTKALGELLRPLNPLPWLFKLFCVCLSIDASPPMESQIVEFVCFFKCTVHQILLIETQNCTAVRVWFQVFWALVGRFGSLSMLLCKCKAVEMYQTYGEAFRVSIITISKPILLSSPSKIANACFIFITSLISVSWVTYQYCTSMR